MAVSTWVTPWTGTHPGCGAYRRRPAWVAADLGLWHVVQPGARGDSAAWSRKRVPMTLSIQPMLPGMPITSDPVARLLSMATVAAEYGEFGPIALDGFEAKASRTDEFRQGIRSEVIVISVCDVTSGYELATRKLTE